MYLLYEFHRSPSGEILVTDMLCTSFYPGRPSISWKNGTEKALFELVKAEFKKVPISQRTYSDKSNIWSFLGVWGKTVHDSIKASPLAAVGVKFQGINGLAEQADSGIISNVSTTAYNAEDFFYTPSAPAPSGPSTEELRSQLASRLGISIAELNSADKLTLKKWYRVKALEYHPDRNNGDGSRMTELNYLWQVYNA